MLHLREHSNMFATVIVVLILISCTGGESPAIQVVLTDKGLQYGKHAGAGWVQEELEVVTLPDMSGDIDVWFGTVHYKLTGINITKCDFPEPSVEFFQDASGFKVSISGLSVALTGGWMIHFWGIHDGGSCNMAVFTVDVSSVVELGKDAEGRLSVASVHCQAQVGDVDISFQGGSSWVYRFFVDHFKDHIKGEIERKICQGVEDSILSMECHLQAMNVSFDVGEILTLDLPLTGSPVINASSLNLGLKGEFYSIQSHMEPPFESQPFTVPPEPGFMLSVGVSEYTLNSALYGFFSTGLLQILITDSMIPQGSPLRLNITSMGKFIPQLPKMFPDLLINLQVYARQTPMFSIQPTAAKLNVQVAAKALAIQPNGTQTPLFTLNVDSVFSGKLWINDGRLKGSVMMDNLTLSLAATEVGPFTTDALENMVRMGMKTIILPKLNGILGNGVILPTTKYAQLVNSVLKMEEGFIAISSDAEVIN